MSFRRGLFYLQSIFFAKLRKFFYGYVVVLKVVAYAVKKFSLPQWACFIGSLLYSEPLEISPCYIKVELKLERVLLKSKQTGFFFQSPCVLVKRNCNNEC